MLGFRLFQNTSKHRTNIKTIKTLFIGIEYGFLLIESSESVSAAQTSFICILKFLIPPANLQMCKGFVINTLGKCIFQAHSKIVHLISYNLTYLAFKCYELCARCAQHTKCFGSIDRRCVIRNILKGVPAKPDESPLLWPNPKEIFRP